MSEDINNSDEFNRPAGSVNQQSCGAPRYFVKDTFSVRSGSQIKYFVSGEEVFTSLADDLAKAQKSIRLLTWGFNPLMAMRRTSPIVDGGDYPESDVIKGILEERARAGVEIKILSWRPGVTARASSPEDTTNPVTGAAPPALFTWFEELSKKRPSLPIQIKHVGSNVTPNPVSATWMAGTPHQKNVVIDAELPKEAIAYVMGHNLVPYYWDTVDANYADLRRAFHIIQPKPGIFKIETVKNGNEVRTEIAALQDKNLHDYSARIRGVMIKDVYDNFSTVWNHVPDEYAPRVETVTISANNSGSNYPAAIKKIDTYFIKVTNDAPVSTLPDDAEYDLDKDEKNICESQYVLTRTSIKDNHRKKIYETYFNSITKVDNFIYMNNQFYRHKELLKKIFNKIIEERPEKIKDIFLFIVTNDFNSYIKPIDTESSSKSEHVNKYNNTYRNLKKAHPELSDEEIVKMAREYVASKPEALWKESTDVPYDYAGGVWRSRSDSPFNYEAAKGMGVNDGFFDVTARADYATYSYLESLKKEYGLKYIWTVLKNKEPPHVEIYTHAKLLIIDDVFVSSGSANFNERSLSNWTGMTGDNEANINVFDTVEVKKLRIKSWNMLLGTEKDWSEVNRENIDEIYNNIKIIAGMNSYIYHNKNHENFDNGIVVLYNPVLKVTLVPFPFRHTL